MSNSTRSIIFTISFLIMMSFFSFLMPKFDFFFDEYLVFINSIITLIVIFFPLIQGICRFVYTRKAIRSEKILFSFKIKQNMTYYRLLNYTFIFLVILFPIYKRIYSEDMTTLALQIISWIGLSELLIQISSKTIKAHFTNNCIIISGIDLRIDIPLSDGIKTHSGIYSYFDIRNFKLENNTLIFNLENQGGKLFVNLQKDLESPVIHYLASKNIKKIL